jgi:hypothetical protein
LPGAEHDPAGPLLEDDGLVETRQGVGSFELRAASVPRPVDVLAELRAARSSINRATAALERPTSNEPPDRVYAGPPRARPHRPNPRQPQRTPAQPAWP